MESQYVILSIEDANYKSKDAILVMANEVEEDDSSHRAIMLGMTFYQYSMTVTDETLYLVFPFSERLITSLTNQAKRYRDNEFVSFDLSDFKEEEMFYNGKRIVAQIHKDLCRDMTRRKSFRDDIIIEDDVVSYGDYKIIIDDNGEVIF